MANYQIVTNWDTENIIAVLTVENKNFENTNKQDKVAQNISVVAKIPQKIPQQIPQKVPQESFSKSNSSQKLDNTNSQYHIIKPNKDYKKRILAGVLLTFFSWFIFSSYFQNKMKVENSITEPIKEINAQDYSKESNKGLENDISKTKKNHVKRDSSKQKIKKIEKNIIVDDVDKENNNASKDLSSLKGL